VVVEQKYLHRIAERSAFLARPDDPRKPERSQTYVRISEGRRTQPGASRPGEASRTSATLH